MKVFDVFIAFIFIVKIIFVFCAVWYKALVKKGLGDTDKAQNLIGWKNNLEFVFLICMAIVCILLFNPFRRTLIIDRETRLLLFVFGIIVFINADWELYFKPSKTFSYLKSVISNRSK
jgi:hypothetical protein